MNKCALLVFSMAVLAIAAGCSKDETTSRDADLAGVNVAVGEKNGPFGKLFVLNEGSFQKNNSTLDFLRFSDGNYVSDAFGTVHRAHASTAGVADYLPAVSGLLIEKELENIPKEKVRQIAKNYIEEIKNNGKRDFRF